MPTLLSLSPCSRRLAIAAAVAALASLSCLSNDFVWDSDELVRQPGTANLWSALKLFSPRVWGRYRGMSGENYHPVAALTFWLDRALWGGSAWGCHLTNLLLHAAAAMLVYGVAAQFAPWPGAAAAAALLFAAHPAHVESVNWVKNRSQLVAIVFALAAIRLAARRPSSTRGQWARALGVLACYAAAMLSHEQAIGAAAIIAFVAWRPAAERRAGDSLLAGAALAAAIVYVTLRFSVLQYQQRIGIPLDYRLSDSGRMVVQNTLLFYVDKVMLPTRCAIDYGSDWLASGRMLRSPATWLALGFAAAFCAAAGRRASTASVFWFLAAAAPALNIIPILGRPLAEQRLYFPSVGACVLVAAAATRRVRNGRAPALLLALCLAFSALTARRSLFWRTPDALWRRAVVAAPDNERPRFNLALACQAAGRTRLARRELEAALRVEPTADAHVNLALMAASQGDYPTAERHLRIAIRMERTPEAHYNLALVYFKTKRYAAALRELGVALRMRPKFFEAKILEGDIYDRLDKVNEATQAYLDAAAIDNQRALPYLCIGDLERRRGDLYAALWYYKRARGVEPDYLPTLYSMAGVYAFLLERAKSNDERRIYWHARRSLYLDILRQDKRQPMAWALLGDMYLQVGDRRRAEECYLRAIQIDPFCQPAREGLQRLGAGR